ncbi:unnamed protein product, partial [Musa acuminata var. zebrina]
TVPFSLLGNFSGHMVRAIISVERECPTLAHKNPGGTKSSHNLMADVGNVKDA